jgi:cell surface protein SprA
MVLPRYLPNTDVVVAEAARVAEGKKLANPTDTGGGADSVTTVSQTMQVSDSYSLSSFHISPPSQFFLIRDILARITLGFNYNKSRFRDPVTEQRSAWSWNSSASYGLSLGTEGFFQPFKSLFSWIPILKEYKDWKIYYQPFQSFQARIGAQRSRQYEQSRLVNSAPRDTRNFGVSKSLGFQWKLTEGGLTGLGGDYGLTMDRNLNDLDNDSVGRDFNSLLHSIFFGGQDNRYSQRVTFNLRPNIPNIFNIKQYFDLTAAYGVNYGWQNTFQRGDIGKGAGFDNNISLAMNVKLKSIFDPLFQQSVETPDPADTAKGKKSGRQKSILNMIKSIGTIFIKVPFLDFENISFQFTEQNRAASNGVVGSTGFLNFWGRLPFQEPVLAWGPTRLFQLGIITDLFTMPPPPIFPSSDGKPSVDRARPMPS